MTTADEHAAIIGREGFTIVEDAIAPEMVDRLILRPPTPRRRLASHPPLRWPTLTMPTP